MLQLERRIQSLQYIPDSLQICRGLFLQCMHINPSKTNGSCEYAWKDDGVITNSIFILFRLIFV